MKTVNSWLFKNPIPTLVDCGEYTKESWEALVFGLRQTGLTVKDIQQIVITHAHVDHVGMANRIVQESGAHVYFSEYAYQWATDLDGLWNQRTRLIRKTFKELIDADSPITTFFSSSNSHFDNMLDMWEPIPSENVIKFQSSDGIEMGGRNWKVIYAPGHSSTQTVFFDPLTHEMMSGDMLLSIAPTPVIELDPQYSAKRQRGLPKLIESFHKMRALNISKAYPGHYAPFENVNELIDRQLSRIEQRLEFTLSKIKEGKDNFTSLFLELYPKRTHFPALVMMIGYLDELEVRNYICKEKNEQGKFRFHPV